MTELDSSTHMLIEIPPCCHGLLSRIHRLSPEHAKLHILGVPLRSHQLHLWSLVPWVPNGCLLLPLAAGEPPLVPPVGTYRVRWKKQQRCEREDVEEQWLKWRGATMDSSWSWERPRTGDVRSAGGVQSVVVCCVCSCPPRRTRSASSKTTSSSS